ncbi:MAG: hypothetical protein ACOYB3_01980 [Azonexus sp.]
MTTVLAVPLTEHAEWLTHGEPLCATTSLTEGKAIRQEMLDHLCRRFGTTMTPERAEHLFAIRFGTCSHDHH